MTSPINVAEYLSRQAAERPGTAALHVPIRNGHRTISFSELNDLSNALAWGLQSKGITNGTRTVLMVPPSFDFFALTFALFKLTAVPVLIDPGMGVKNLGPCLATAEPEAFIGIKKAHLGRWWFGWGKPTIRTTVHVGKGRFFCSDSTEDLIYGNQHHDEFNSPPVEESDLAAILFTSGSTGPAKGVEYTHGIFASQVQMLKQTYGIEPGEIDFCSFPLFALFGPALGMTCVVPQMDASKPSTINPEKAYADIGKFGVTNLFGSPAVIRRLADHGKPLKSIRRAISAGAPATIPVVESFAGLLENGVELFTPYGATESLPVANIGSNEILNETRFLTESGHGVCIGKPVAGMKVEIISITDEAIETWNDSLIVPQGEIGEFAVRGPVVTQRYFGNPTATQKAKIKDSTTGEIIHRMGDVGYFDTNGRLWFCGRKSHRVVTASETYFTDQVEPIFNQTKGIFRTALVGVIRKGVTFPVLIYELLPDTTPIPDGLQEDAEFRHWANELAKQGEQFPITSKIQTFLFHYDFPMDVRHQSKINREKLAIWADQKLSRDWNGGPAK